MFLMNAIVSTDTAIDHQWLLVSAAMIFLMQTGFAMVECGSVRAKNSRNILIKNLFDACLGALAFWLIGYGLAFGVSEGGFIGSDRKFFAASAFESFFSDGTYKLEDNHYVYWMF